MRRKEKFDMKRKILYAVLLLLAVLCVAYVISSWRMVGKHTDKIWLEQCNTMEKLQKMQTEYPNFQVDVLIREDSTLLVLQGEDSLPGQPIDPYFEFLAEHSQSHMWMTMKNLSEQNIGLFMDTLVKLFHLYKADKRQLVVETTEWNLMRIFTISDFYTVYPMEAPNPSDLARTQKDSVITRVSRIANSGCVKAIGIPSKWYGPLHNQFLDMDIEFVTRKSGTSQFGLMLSPVGRIMLDDSRMHIILL